MGQNGHFYSCMGLRPREIGFSWVDGLLMDLRVLGRHILTI